MHWTDHAILLSVTKQGESAAVLRLLAREHGLHGGLVRGVFSKKNRGVYMPGNQVEAQWSARLSEHLGNLQCELVYPVAALLLDDPLRLAALNAVCSIICVTLAEREQHPALYDALLAYEQVLLDPRATPAHIHALLALFELFLLQELGYALDLSICAATGATEELIYISPKTGRAVSREAGAPYHGKLLPLPGFLSTNFLDAQSFCRLTPPPLPECVDAVKVSGYFLEAWVFQPLGRKFPAARERFLQMLHKQPA